MTARRDTTRAVVGEPVTVAASPRAKRPHALPLRVTCRRCGHEWQADLAGPWGCSECTGKYVRVTDERRPELAMRLGPKR